MPSLCGPEGWDIFSPSDPNDLSACFESRILTLIPAVLFFVFSVLRLWYIRRHHGAKSQDSFKTELQTLFWAKNVVYAFLTALAVADVIRLSISDVPIYGYEWLIAICQLVSFILMWIVSNVEHVFSLISSPTLLLYLPMLLVNYSLQLHTSIRLGLHQQEPITFAFFVVLIVLLLTSWVLELLPKTKFGYVRLDEDPNPCPQETANIYSIMSFSWLNSLMMAGHKKFLTESDLFNLNTEDHARQLSNKFQQAWCDQKRRPKPSLVKALALAFGRPFILAAMFKLVQDALAFAQPQLLKQLMSFIREYSTQPETTPGSRGVWIATMMLVVAVTQSICLHQYFQRVFVVGMRVRAGIVTAVYQKALFLSNSSRQSSTSGEIVNLQSVDAQRLQDLCAYLTILLSGPFQISVAIYFLYDTMGWSIFAGLGTMIFMVPINILLAKRMRVLQKQQMSNKDSRMKLMDEVLNSIKVLKLYGWLQFFYQKVLTVREKELTTIKRIGYNSAFQNFTWSCTPYLVSFTVFTVYSLTSSEPLLADKIFVAISLFNLLQFPLSVFPVVIAACVEASVSVNRIHSFLLKEEIDPTSVVRLNKNDAPFVSYPSKGMKNVQKQKHVAIRITNGQFTWNLDSPPVLRDINIQVIEGEMAAIVGKVGVGKSSLIQALLGDLYKTRGEVQLYGSVAYSSQEAWIMNATVRENILFGHIYDPDYYNTVLEACGLTQDLQILPGGDLTEIGEKGINLSGGQKARVSLARAVYARADIYLLDDPLSAVDAHVGKHIFDKVLDRKNGLLRKKTVLLVTHGIQYLPSANNIISLGSDQTVAETGTFEELMARKGDFAKIMEEFGKGYNSPDRDTSKDVDVSNDDISKPIGSPNAVKSNLHDVKEAREKKRNKSSDKTTLINKEETQQGKVDKKVFIAYAKCADLSSCVLYGILLVLTQCALVGSNIWLKSWGNNNDSAQGNTHLSLYLSVYGVTGLVFALLTIAQVIVLWVFVAIKSARTIHQKMLRSVLKSPMSFFDTTPLGRVTNRFSKDIYTVDEVIPRSFHSYFRTLFQVVSIVIVIGVSTPIFLPVIVPLAIFYLYIQRYYLATSRELKRLDSVTRSPIYAHFGETLGGVSVIRAYRQVGQFIEENEYRIDANQKAYFPSLSSNRWLAIRLELIGAIVIFSSSLFAVISVLYIGGIDSGSVGLSVSYALQITQTINWMLRQYCEIETNAVGAERCLEYINLTPEAPDSIPDKTPPETWPQKGTIEYHKYSTRYREGLDLVLKKASFQIKSGEKIGIVGRTGAGKSSLTLSLFRLIEAVEGRIMIDDVDISTIGLQDLRARLSIIPQDPALFHGTLRENLDPEKLETDEQLLTALSNAHFNYSKYGLDSTISQGGENLSVGERQLVCLARALLRKSRIIVLDEATAAIDVKTDSLIQKTIRTNFKDCTVLTIAHRIDTILDADRVMVLDSGKIIEFDSPKALINNPASIFANLARESGISSIP